MSPIPRNRIGTGKRETAWSLILLLIIAGVYAAAGGDAEMVTARVRLVEVLAWPIISFAAFAYGADWIAKQTNLGGPPLAERDLKDEYEGKVG